MSPRMDADLDRPAWAALTTRQAHLGYRNESGNANAYVRRYQPDVAPFAGLSSETPAAYEALGALLQPHEHVVVQTLEPVVQTPALQATPLGMVRQMVASRRVVPRAEALRTVLLGEPDRDDILALVQRTRPGPFAKRTIEMGRYVGLRDQGRLVAMVGERMSLDGYVELSAVCVDDGWRGRGIAGRLIEAQCQRLQEQAVTPFLHVLNDNHTAIALYERLGFTLRRTFFLTKFELRR
jgi:predicted GNAT family acetyltransferase